MPVSKDFFPIAGASGNQGAAAYNIDQSIRFDEKTNAYMHRTPSGAGNRRTWTWSGWLKHTTSTTSGYHNIWTARSDNNNFFEIAKRVTASGDNFMDITNMTSSTRDIRLITNRHFRDVSAWYHFVFVLDTTNDVASERVRFYVNGTRETSFSTETYPSKNLDTFINTTNKHEIGAYNGGAGYMMDGYMADIHFIDGYAYGPEFFGELKEDTDIWVPIKYTGTYGTNGYKIDGRDASDLGDDESGNGNDYTTVNLAAHDQVLDTPTNNFAVLNSTDTFAKLDGEVRNGNLELKDNSGSAYVYGRATFGFDVTDSGGWYWELCDIVEGSAIAGITEFNTALPSGSSLAFTGARGFNSINTGSHMKLENTTYNSVNLGVTSNAGDIIQFCAKNGKLFIGINGTYVLSGNPATEANPLFTGLTGTFMPFAGLYSGASYNTIHNFGQDGTFGGNKTAQGNTDANGFGNFFYAPPTGAKALCSRSLGA